MLTASALADRKDTRLLPMDTRMATLPNVRLLIYIFASAFSFPEPEAWPLVKALTTL